MLNRGALVRRGWTPGLIEAILRRPDRVEQHHRGFQRWSEHLFAEARVVAGEADARFLEAASRRKARGQSAARRRAEIPTRYADWRDALGEAAGYLFSLNRYAKHRTCSPLQRVEIYTLKNEFLRLLYERGCCRVAWVHRLTLPARPCRECAGEGGDCGHCGGSGIWQAEKTVEFWCFRFVVAGRTYCWHQPRASVAFAPVASAPPADWSGITAEKPVVLPRRRFAYAKELLRWVIDASAGEEPAEVAMPAGGQLPLFAA